MRCTRQLFSEGSASCAAAAGCCRVFSAACPAASTGMFSGVAAVECVSAVAAGVDAGAAVFSAVSAGRMTAAREVKAKAQNRPMMKGRVAASLSRA